MVIFCTEDIDKESGRRNPPPPLPPFPPSLLRAPAVLACMEEKEEKTVASGRRCRIERYIR